MIILDEFEKYLKQVCGDHKLPTHQIIQEAMLRDSFVMGAITMMNYLNNRAENVWVNDSNSANEDIIKMKKFFADYGSARTMRINRLFYAKPPTDGQLL